MSIEATYQDRDQEYEQFIKEDNRLATVVIVCISELERSKKGSSGTDGIKKIYRTGTGRTGDSAVDTTRRAHD